jgi:hypothetical protein
MTTMAEFIERNATEIDACINAVMYRHDGNGGRGTIPTPAPVYDNDEREEWITAGDEGLWNWAIAEGVDVYGEDD